MPDCEYFESLLSRQLDEPLPANDAAELDTHLKSCRSCRNYAESLERDRNLIQSLPLEALGRPLPESMRPSPIVRLWRARITLPAPAAAILIAALLGLGVLLDPGSHQPGSANPAVSQRPVHVITLQPASAVRVNP